MAQKSECCIFIDNSNLFIEGQKFFARNKGLRLTVTHDIRFRIDIGRLVEVLAGNRKITYAKLYGSEPPANDSLWKRIRSKGVEVGTFQRNANDVEKQLDTALASDVTEKAVRSSMDSSVQPSMTFIIIGGDRDYLPPCEKVLKCRFNLEVAAWKSCLSQELKKYIEKKLGSSHLLSLDDIATKNPSVYYLADQWTATKPLPRERTIVFEFAFDIDAEDAKYLNTEVTELIKLPCRYLQQNPRHLMIIIIINENSGKYSTCRLLEDIYKHVRQDEKFRENIKQVVDYVKFKQDQNDPELFERNIYLNQKFYAEEEDNEEDLDDCEGFEVVGPTRKHKTYQKYSEMCPLKFACRLGKQCRYEHSPEEREHFETPSNVGKLYKSKYCLHEQNGRCKFKNDSKKCCFAHSLSEARCYNCQPGGLVGEHWMDECKLKKS